MKDIIADIARLKQEMNDFYRIASRPAARDPATAAGIGALEREMKKRRLPVPPSYRAFLEITDGFANIDYRLDLLAVAEVIRPPSEELEDDFPELCNFVVGAGSRPAFVAFDPETADAAGEMELVWVADDGTEYRYPTFAAFLATYRDRLAASVASERADRQKLDP